MAETLPGVEFGFQKRLPAGDNVTPRTVYLHVQLDTDVPVAKIDLSDDTALKAIAEAVFNPPDTLIVGGAIDEPFLRKRLAAIFTPEGS